MKRAAIAFFLGLFLGVVLGRDPHPLSDSPWPAPTPSPTLAETERTVDRLTCEALVQWAVLKTHLRDTCRPNPPECVP